MLNTITQPIIAEPTQANLVAHVQPLGQQQSQKSRKKLVSQWVRVNGQLICQWTIL